MLTIFFSGKILTVKVAVAEDSFDRQFQDLPVRADISVQDLIMMKVF